ncbi:leucine-rich repeat-containing G-protein coupled receptor 6-like [Lingula anatina]|uniref:Leucine-rich repeat-containing G-protein coupled receptor 6-like n=1 Tax=Lingula anatina TaxID=7574 RepID=A0A1S3J219_LINAN|nr:leucine-rich repeat-containing G-protein coupled receptor 6-like [Lingula anatina]XP_013404480.1 leucine-rich repeat-containing G-protein coupled receptor 6-like [Lingula anatina]|eukprot:XP_013404470.1 leucine-rich repeat-containing G-protein coupled receptor 6-like [Lingula anatina]
MTMGSLLYYVTVLQLVVISRCAVRELPKDYFRCPTPCTCTPKETGMAVICGKDTTELPSFPNIILQEFGAFDVHINSLSARTFENLKAREVYLLYTRLGNRINVKTFDPLAPYLERLFLQDLYITAVPTRLLRQLNNLKQLSISENNHLTSLSGKLFYPLPNLKTLSLKKNALTALEDKTFSTLSQLRDLDLTGNKLSHIGAETFRGLTRLESLDLSSNELTTIPPLAFQDLQNVKVLNLSNNQIDKVEADAFIGLESLKYIDLTGNAIDRLRLCDLKGLPEGVQIKLNNNPINCDCNIKFWREEQLFTFMGTCKMPAAVEGQPISTFVPNTACPVRRVQWSFYQSLC